MADQWITPELNRLAKALQAAGYQEAGEFVAIAALSVQTDSKLKSRRKSRRSNLSEPATASDSVRSVAIVVPFLSRRGPRARSS
jgi:hypothetical protein